MFTYDAREFGKQLRDRRMQLGWSAQKLVELYSEFVGRQDSPPSPAFIYRVETGATKLEATRRAILASLVGLPLPLDTCNEDTSMLIDISEYTHALECYCRKWHNGTLLEARDSIQERTSRLWAAAWSATGETKTTLTELFGFYHIVLADVCGIARQPARAYEILSATIEIARQEKLPTLHVYALSERAGTVLGRFETTKDQALIQTAIDDYAEAAKERNHLSPFYRGLLDMRQGVVDAYIARDQPEFRHALRVITQGSKQIGIGASDVRIIARIDTERYLLSRAAAYLYSPQGNPGLALAELEELDRYCPLSKGQARLTERHRLFAEAYLATGDYPMAVSHLEAALETASFPQAERLIEIHTRLKNTSYWNNPDMGRIAVKINQMRFPCLFYRVSLLYRVVKLP